MNSPYGKQPLLSYDGKIGELYGIFFKNLLLQIVTLGIYRFWATTNMRRYVWSRMRFQGERFEYTGTGGELFKGFLLALVALFGTAIGTAILSFVLRALTHSNFLSILPFFAMYALLAIVAAGAYYSAQRYRLSRTVWCGIRGGMSGSALAYGARVLLYGLLLIVTLGQMAPWVAMRLSERRINASSFGSEAFHFQGRARALYGAFLGTFVGVVALAVLLGSIFLKSIKVFLAAHGPLQKGDPATAHVMLSVLAFYLLLLIGSLLIQCYYLALVTRHVTGNTALGTQLRFGSGLTGVRLMSVLAGNLAIVFCTLGLGYPLALHRGLRLAADTLLVEGTLDPHTLGQNNERAPRTGEGMLNLLDHGGAL
jgi:uncharacterized membrane protein YjgN (DUF898 family)